MMKLLHCKQYIYIYDVMKHRSPINPTSQVECAEAGNPTGNAARVRLVSDESKWFLRGR